MNENPNYGREAVRFFPLKKLKTDKILAVRLEGLFWTAHEVGCSFFLRYGLGYLRSIDIYIYILLFVLFFIYFYLIFNFFGYKSRLYFDYSKSYFSRILCITPIWGDILEWICMSIDIHFCFWEQYMTLWIWSWMSNKFLPKIHIALKSQYRNFVRVCTSCCLEWKGRFSHTRLILHKAPPSPHQLTWNYILYRSQNLKFRNLPLPVHVGKKLFIIVLWPRLLKEWCACLLLVVSNG